MSISENGHDSSGLVIDDVRGVLVGLDGQVRLARGPLKRMASGNLTQGAQLFLHL